jgi:hypothetical protein
MKEALAVLAGILLGSGIGLVVSGWLLGTLLQPLIITTLGFCTVLLKPRSKYWASALALSIASALTAAGLRVAITALYLLATGNESARALLILPEIPPQTLTGGELAPLLGLSLALTIGQALLMDGISRVLSPLWSGVEALSTTLAPALEVRPKDLALGAPLGVVSALVDVQLDLKCVGFIALVAVLTPISSASTLAFHGFLTIIFSRLLEEITMNSIGIGIQVGVLTATSVAALLLYLAGGATVYSKAAVSIAAVVSGFLILVLSFAALVGPQWAVYLALVALVFSFISILIAIRSEGGFLLPLFLPNSLAPSSFWLVWSHVVSQLNLNPDVVAIAVNPTLLMLLAAMTIWGFRLSGDSYTSMVLMLSLAAPIALLLLRNSVKPELAFISDYYAWKLPGGGKLPSVDFAVTALTAAIVAVLTIFVYYMSSPSSRVRYTHFLFDPNGLFFAYGFASNIWGQLNGGYERVLFFTIVGAVAIAKLIVQNFRVLERLKLRDVTRGALSIYWLAYALSLALRYQT